MLSRAFNGAKAKKIPIRASEAGSSRSQSSLRDHEECIVGFMGDLPLTFCDGGNACANKTRWRGYLCLREVLKASVQVMGESDLGISEKVVLLDGRVFATKRFRRVTVLSRRSFGKRVERLAQVGKGCDNLVQIRAYLYAKRIKLLLCDYHPMGSLSDLLDGARELGHTPLDWGQRLRIMLDVARAVAYIHGQAPAQEKGLQLNVHGNIKTSNVIIKTNFSACLSEYGFVQLAEPAEVLNVWRQNLPETIISVPQAAEGTKMTQKNDIYGFGVVVLDMLGGPRAPLEIDCILKRKEEISKGEFGFFEFFVEGRERKQALQVLDIALACTNKFPETRPSIEQILLLLGGLYRG